MQDNRLQSTRQQVYKYLSFLPILSYPILFFLSIFFFQHFSLMPVNLSIYLHVSLLFFPPRRLAPFVFRPFWSTRVNLRSSGFWFAFGSITTLWRRRSRRLRWRKQRSRNNWSSRNAPHPTTTTPSTIPSPSGPTYLPVPASGLAVSSKRTTVTPTRLLFTRLLPHLFPRSKASARLALATSTYQAISPTTDPTHLNHHLSLSQWARNNQLSSNITHHAHLNHHLSQ